MTGVLVFIVETSTEVMIREIPKHPLISLPAYLTVMAVEGCAANGTVAYEFPCDVWAVGDMQQANA